MAGTETEQAGEARADGTAWDPRSVADEGRAELEETLAGEAGVGG